MAVYFDNHDITGYQSNADFGARRIFGTRGSLVSYINTGNPYPDSFIPRKTKNVKKAKNNNATQIVRTLVSCGAILTSVLLVVGRIKNKKALRVSPPAADALPVKQKFGDRIKKFFTRTSEAPITGD